ncbi:MAG TPA: flagellar basal body P-ring formation chaperone FlgA [Alphaproteobacteria bacterium]|nr:flagellar basal body P-ring formation chaperone FlgA [Alphaproteobacteria bacterium]
MKQTENTAKELISATADTGKSLFMALVMTVLVVGKAWAGDVAAPRGETVVTADVITVGDVFDGAGRYAGHELAPAPALGAEMVLSAHDLARISDAFGFGWRSQNGMEKTVIRRDAQEIDRFQIEAALQDKLSAALPNQRFETVFDSRSSAFYIPPHEAAALEVEDLRYDLSRGVFRATLSAAGLRRDISGQLYLLTSVPVLSQPKRMGDIITASDITQVDIRAADIAAHTVIDAAQLVGLAPRRNLPALRTIAAGDIVQPTLVKKGDMVTVTLQSGPIHLTTQARALENGAAGELVKVMNMSSRQVLDAVVTGMQAVSVRVAGS